MIGVDLVYGLAGALFAVVAVLGLFDRSNPKRVWNAIFWGAYSATLLAGHALSDFANGCLVLVLAFVGGAGGLGRGAPRGDGSASETEGAARWGNRLFVPALLLPALTLAGSFGLRRIHVGELALFAPKDSSVVSLGLAACAALAVAMVMFRQRPAAAGHEARRLLDLVGWAIVLPQLLAALGGVFAEAGVGSRIAALVERGLGSTNVGAIVATYTVGMALFTMVMGNAFAAFPVMTAGIGLPLLVHRFGGDPAAVGAIGMLAGFSGTLMTPMAANFNIVPAALLELPDKNAVLRVQVPTAVALLFVDTLLLYIVVR